MNRNGFKLLTILVLFIYSWTFGGLFSIAHAYKGGQESPAREQPKQRPETKFQQTIDDIDGTLTNASLDRPAKKARLKSKKEELEALDSEIKKQFSDTEKKLKGAGLPKEILRRHYDFVKHYEENLKKLRTNLEALEKARTDEAADAELGKIRKHLEEVKPPQKRKLLDPHKLPHRTREAKKREPRLKKKDFLRDSNQQAETSPASRLRTDFSDPFVIPAQSLSSTPDQVRGGLRSGRGIQDHLQGTKEKRPILLASNGPLEGLLASSEPLAEPSIILAQTTNQPTPSDLAETIEIQFTPAIIAKAQELGHNPVKIYNWVRNNIEYVPTYGSIQGADMCLQTLQGNDFDIASLLIALLRASNITARYVYGTIELPIEKVMNWAGGFTDAQAAMDFISAGGTPVSGIISGGRISAVRMEHVWVEAFIDYFPSRGARHITGQGDAWIPLDGSYKQYSYTQGIDINAAVPFDKQTLMNEIQDTAIIDTVNSSITGANTLHIYQQLQDYQAQVQNYLSQNFPDATIEDILIKKEIIKQEFPYLLGTLPYKRIVTGAKYSELPDTLRHKITFSVMKDIFDTAAINITKSLPEIAGKKITLSYIPATPQDESVINSYLPQPHPDGTPIQPDELPTSLPAYLINLKPELRIDGIVVATGSTVGMGMQETIDMIFSEPGPWGVSEIVSNQINSGAYYAIAIDSGKVSEAQMLTLKTKLEMTRAKIAAYDFTNLTKDDIVGEMLYGTAVAYYKELDTANYLLSKDLGVVCYRYPSEAIFSFEIDVDMLFGIPKTASAGGFVMDVDKNVNIITALDGVKRKRINYVIYSGMNSSALEHSVPEKMFSSQQNPVQSISAVKALTIANDQGVPVHVINQSNINVILPQLELDSHVIADIQNSINSGNIFIVPKSDITLNKWTGRGYIVINPTNGEGAYMISGGLNGSQDTDPASVAKLVGLIVVGSLVASAAIVVLAYYASSLLTTMILSPLFSVYLAHIVTIAVVTCIMDLTPPSPPDAITLACVAALLLLKGLFK